MYHRNNYLANRLKNNTNEYIVTVFISINFQFGVHRVIANELVGRESATPNEYSGQSRKTAHNTAAAGEATDGQIFPRYCNRRRRYFRLQCLHNQNCMQTPRLTHKFPRKAAFAPSFFSPLLTSNSELLLNFLAAFFLRRLPESTSTA